MTAAHTPEDNRNDFRTERAAHHLTHPPYRPDIDGLRAIAVLAVVGFHAFPDLLHGGFIGVDVFFVISGFLISTIIFDSLQRDSFSFLAFYSRRIKRIFPALLLVLIACFAFGWFALLADEYKQLGEHIAGSAGFVSNFVLWNESGYFDNTAATKPLLHLWSLGIEEQFYLAWPLLLWLAWKRRFNLLTITIIVAAVSFALNIGLRHSDIIGVFYSPQTRFWELLAGSVLAWLALKKYEVFPRLKSKLDAGLGRLIYAERPATDGSTLRDVQAWLGAAVLVAGMLIITTKWAFPGWWAVLPVMASVLVISAGPQTWINRKLLSNRVLVWFGLISFPLYLWHWPLLSFARTILSETPSLKMRIALVLLSVVLAWLTYLLIERPIRFGKSGPATSIILVVLMCVVGWAGYNCYKRDGLSFRSHIRHTKVVNSQFVGPLWKFSINDICLKNQPLDGSDKYLWWFCMESRDEKPTVLLLGNSYVNHLYPGLAENAAFRHHNFLSIGACEPEWADESVGADKKPPDPCAAGRPFRQQQFINDIVERNASIRFAIMGGLHEYPDDEYISRLKRRVDFLEAHKIKVIIFSRHLKVDYDIKGCFARPFKQPRKSCELSLQDRQRIEANAEPLVRSFAVTNPDVAFFDENDLFCDTQKCSMIKDGMPLFRDEYQHLSEYGSIELGKLFEKWARVHVPQFFQVEEAARPPTTSKQ
ncbi:MAG: O-antigen acetylase [Rhodocyclales bacterium]|nr:O-antigen acetylase [Rhodocyclales bacterium]